MTDLLRQLPSIDDLLNTKTAHQISASAGRSTAVSTARNAVDELRRNLLDNSNEGSFGGSLLSDAEELMASLWNAKQRSGVRHVINATGVIIHTNLGRSPLSENAKRALLDRAADYCALEIDIETGKRGKRGSRAEELICEITGAEAALIVNNCAAAAFFVLTAFASGKEVVISRGELVEIGGDFRVPDVLERSGAVLREVGTTNRTKLRDYENAISAATGMVLRVHPSNYRVVGFTETPTLRDVADLAHRYDVMLFEDAGSGALVDLSEFGLGDEPVISRSIADGADIVGFSGDKLLGGSQAGILAGKRDLIETLRRHPLYRAFRVDKLSYAVLEATLESYVSQRQFEEVPVLRLISMEADEILPRALCLAEDLREKTGGHLEIDVVQGESVVGGGSAPDVKPSTWLVSISKLGTTAEELESKLRGHSTPVISRITDDRVVLDLRTVFDGEYLELLAAAATLGD